MKLLLQALLFAGLITLAAGPVAVMAQAPAAAPLPVAEGQAFLGAWNLAIDAEGQTFNLDLMIRDVEGALAGEVNSDFGASTVTRFRRNGDALVLSYSADMNGEAFPIMITMNPTPDGADVVVDAGDGAFVSRGKATRK